MVSPMLHFGKSGFKVLVLEKNHYIGPQLEFRIAPVCSLFRPEILDLGRHGLEVSQGSVTSSKMRHLGSYHQPDLWRRESPDTQEGC